MRKTGDPAEDIDKETSPPKNVRSENDAERNIHKDHRERVKDTFREYGLVCFNDIQLLEFLLFYAIPRVDTNPHAHRLLDTFGSFKGVLDADYEELIKVKGIGESAATYITMLRQAAQRYFVASNLDTREPITDTDSLRGYYEGIFMGEKNEQFRAMLIDDHLCFVKEKIISAGSPDKVEGNIRGLVEFVIKNGCSRVVIAHNHPNGLCMPSRADIEVTIKFVKALDDLDITLLDHIIVGRTGSWSMLSSGLKEQCIYDGDAVFSLKDIVGYLEESLNY